MQKAASMLRPSPRMVLFGVFAFLMTLGVMMIATGPRNDATQLMATKAVERSVLGSDGFLQNSKFVVTKASRSYDVNPKPSCWQRHCDKQNNWLAFSTCDSFSEVATEWNSLGVRTMERYVGTTSEKLDGLSDVMLRQARDQFANASEAAQGKCWSAAFNLAVVTTKLNDLHAAAALYAKAAEVAPNSELQAITHLYWGVNEELRSADSIVHYDKVRQLDVIVETDYWGVATTAQARKGLTGYGQQQTPPAMRDFILYKHFGSVSIARYSLLPPGTQDAFIQSRYAVLRHVLPPFVLAAVQKCFKDMIDSGQLKYGDGQSDRYVTYNDRCSRFIHYAVTDLVRTTIAHNAVPSYTYFGGYKGGSQLKPHTDREQCEFTMSLNLQQFPHDKPWTLSAVKTPLFERGKFTGRSPDKLPPESEIVNADLLSGDGFLFMGRHLVHFRRGALPEGHWTNQVFLHYVQEDFKGDLG